MKHCLLSILIIFEFLLKYDFYPYNDYSKEYNEYDKEEWFSGRHIKPAVNYSNIPESQTRSISVKISSGGIKISSGKDKDKSMTVPDCGKASVSLRIVNGKETNLGLFPWAALIETNGNPICGGTILNERWILTAAHCFKERKGAAGLTVRVGMIDSKLGTVYKVSKLVMHEMYNKDGMENSDIALLSLSNVIKMEKKGDLPLINGACLPERNAEPKGKTLIVVGWGRTGENEETSRKLRQVSLSIMNEVECARKFKAAMEGYPKGYNIYRSQICAYTPKYDACQGDSGGPAIQYEKGRAILIGLVSFGVGCATDYPGIYTKISHFLDWIASHMK